MGTERRVLLAAALSILLLTGYTQWLNRSLGARGAAPKTATPSVELSAPTLATDVRRLPDEETALIESPRLKLSIGTHSGAIRCVWLKGFENAEKSGPLEFCDAFPRFMILDREQGLEWRSQTQNQAMVELVASTHHDEKKYHLLYRLDERTPVVSAKLIVSNNHEKSEDNAIISISYWNRADTLDARSNQLESVATYLEKPDRVKHRRIAAQAKSRVNVPRGTFILALAERYFCSAISVPASQWTSVIVPSPQGIIGSETTVSIPQTPSGNSEIEWKIYLGPRDFFYLKQAGIEQAFPVGMLGQIGLLFLLLLKWLAGVTKNYGVAIIVFSAIISGLSSPFTVIGLRASKKMQELAPLMERIREKHKDDPMKAHQETLALWKAHKVSPAAGCLPMFFQIPIFIALIGAISHFVGLRGQEFLWIKDLSLPDKLAQLPVGLPLLGRELNVLPIIMAGAMFIQMKLTQPKTVSRDASSAMMAGPIMPILFGVMFYHVPSGLVLYWLSNTIATLGWYRLLK